MTTATPVPAQPVKPRFPVRLLPMAGGILACGALGMALLAGAGGSPIATVALATAAAACLASEMALRGWRILRSSEGPLLGLIMLMVVLAAVAAVIFGVSLGSLVALVLGVVGSALVVHGLGVLHQARGATTTPWGVLRGVSTHDLSGLVTRVGGPVVGGAIIILVGFAIDSAPAVLGLLGVVIVPLIRAVRAPAHATHANAPDTRHPATRPPDEVAAHLHDSVLQTLALIQRSAHDPARVAQLARHQEHSLRDWLAGRSDADAPTTLAAALRAIAHEVEQDVPGATVDVVTVGTVPLDRRTNMLVQAAREAVRNAARHGSPRVRVFAECDASSARVFIRDTGPGFSLADIPNDRRGVRDAMIGRMEHVDGTVAIDSGEHGTEIELNLPSGPD